MSKDVEVKITADSSNAQRELRDTANSIDNVGRTAKNSEGKLKAITDALKSIASNTGTTNNHLVQLGAELKALNASVNALSGNLQKMAKSANNAGNAVQDMGNKAKGASGDTNKMAASLSFMASSQIGQILANTARELVGMGASAIMAAAQMRQYEIAFQTMLKSADAGTQMLKDLQQFAASTPFDVPGVVQAGQQLMAFGFKAKEVIPMLTSLGDAAAGLGKGTAGVSQLAYALGQMQTSGKLNAQDMMQLTNAGIAAWDMLAKAAGKSVMEIKDLTSKGMIDSKEAVKVIVAGMNNEFGGMMEKTSQEVTGLLANIEETAGTTSAVIGQYMIDAFNIKGILSEASESLGEFQQYLMESKEKGLSFTQMINGAGEGAQAFTIALGALAGVIGVTLVGALVAAIGALSVFAGITAPIAVAAAAMGTLLTSLALGWDDLTASVNKAINAVKNFFGIASDEKGGYGGSFADEAPKTPKKPVVNSNLIIPSNKTNGKHHKTDEEREIDSLLKKYNKVSNAFKDIKYQVDELKVAASTMFGDGKAIKEHEADLAQIQYDHDKIESELKAELELAEKIPNAEDRSYVIGQIQKQIDAEKNLYDAKVKAENYKFEHRNDKSSSEKADSIIARAFGTEDEMQEKREKLKRFLTDIQDMAANNQQTGNFNDVSAGDLKGQGSYIQRMLGKTPEELEGDWAAKSEGFARFIDYISSKMAEAQAAEQKNAEIGQQWADLQTQWIGNIGSSMGNAVSEWINGTKTIGQAMKDMVKNLLSQAAQLLAEWTMVFALISAFAGTKAGADAANKMVLGIGDGGKIFKKAKGGYISGAGTGTSDSIPAMLSNGEYVIRASAVDALGIPFLNGLNSGKYQYSTGGLVGAAPNFSNDVAASASVGNSSGSSVVLNINAIDASGFSDFLARGGLDSIKEAMFADDLRFASLEGAY